MNTPKEIEGIRFLGLEKLDEERLAIKSLINKWIIMLCVGLFFLIGTIGNGYLLSTALILGVLIYSFRHLFFQRIKDADDTFQFFFVTERDTDFTFSFLRAG